MKSHNTILRNTRNVYSRTQEHCPLSNETAGQGRELLDNTQLHVTQIRSGPGPIPSEIYCYSNLLNSFRGSSDTIVSSRGIMLIYLTRISGPDGPLILAVDLRNTPTGGGYGRTDGRTHPHTALYI